MKSNKVAWNRHGQLESIAIDRVRSASEWADPKGGNDDHARGKTGHPKNVGPAPHITFDAPPAKKG